METVILHYSSFLKEFYCYAKYQGLNIEVRIFNVFCIDIYTIYNFILKLSYQCSFQTQEINAK